MQNIVFMYRKVLMFKKAKLFWGCLCLAGFCFLANPVGLFGLTAETAYADSLAPARIDLVTVETSKGRFVIQAEIADTSSLRERGLMFRQRIPQNRGMLFDWGKTKQLKMWMRNTYVSLDMIFISGSGHVVSVTENTEPKSLKTILSGAPARAVLEMVAGSAKRMGVKIGDKVEHAIFLGG